MIRENALGFAAFSFEAQPPMPPPGPVQFTRAVDDLVEATARSMGYNSAATCAGYVTSAVPQWAAEAAAFIAWRDAVWQVVLTFDPASPPASIEAALALLPPFTRPGA